METKTEKLSKEETSLCFTLPLFHCRDIHSGLDSQTKCVTLCGWTSSTTLRLSTCWLTPLLPSSPKWHFSETQKLHYQLWQKSVNHFQRIGVGHLWFLAWICMFALAWTEELPKNIASYIDHGNDMLLFHVHVQLFVHPVVQSTLHFCIIAFDMLEPICELHKLWLWHACLRNVHCDGHLQID